MKRYGETLRELRQAKGYLQKEVYRDIVAKSFAIKFEKGEVMLQYDTFLDVLRRINVTQEEFHFIHQGYQLADITTVWSTFTQAVNTSNYRKLMSIYHDYRDSRVVFETVIAYLAHALVVYNDYSVASFHQQLDHNELVYMQEYLLGRTSWTLDEINIFTMCYFLFEPEVQKDLIKTCYQSLRNYRQYANYHERMTDLLANYILHCYGSGEYQEGNRWFVKLQSLPKKQTELSLGLRRDLCEAYYVYTKGDFIQADQLISNYQLTFTSAGYADEAQTALKQFRTFKGNYDANNIRIIKK